MVEADQLGLAQLVKIDRHTGPRVTALHLDKGSASEKRDKPPQFVAKTAW